MGLSRNNLARQRMGKLLSLTRDEQEARQDWEKSRPIHRLDRIGTKDENGKIGIVPSRKDVFSWGEATIADVERILALGPNSSEHEKASCFRYTPAGKKTLTAKAPSWYTPFRTDKTDAIRRMADSKTRRKLENIGG